MEIIYRFKLISKAKLMFWAFIVSLGTTLSFYLLKKPDMAFRPGNIYQLLFMILGRDIDENEGNCPGIHKVKELNRWNLMILITGACFALSLSYR